MHDEIHIYIYIYKLKLCAHFFSLVYTTYKFLLLGNERNVSDYWGRLNSCHEMSLRFSILLF